MKFVFILTFIFCLSACQKKQVVPGTNSPSPEQTQGGNSVPTQDENKNGIEETFKLEDVSINALGFYEQQLTVRSKKELKYCRDQWEKAIAKLIVKGDPVNPFDVLISSAPDAGEVSYVIDKEVDGTFTRLIPSKLQKMSVSAKSCDKCAPETVNCIVPTSWKVLDSRVSVNYAPELMKIDQCLEGSDTFCTTSISSLGGLGFFYFETSLDKPYGYLSWRLGKLAISDQANRIDRIRSEFQIDKKQTLEIVSISNFISNTINNPVREVHFSDKASNVKYPGVIFDQQLSNSFKEAKLNEVFLPLSDSPSRSFKVKGSREYYRDLFQGGEGEVNIPGFSMLNVITEDDDTLCADSVHFADVKKCRKFLNNSIYDLVKKTLKTGSEIKVTLILGGKGEKGPGSAFFNQLYTITSEGNVTLDSSTLIDPKDYQNYVSLRLEFPLQ